MTVGIVILRRWLSPIGDFMAYQPEALAKLGQSVTPANAGVQKSMKQLDSVLQRNDEEALLQKAQPIQFP